MGKVPGMESSLETAFKGKKISTKFHYHRHLVFLVMYPFIVNVIKGITDDISWQVDE